MTLLDQCGCDVCVSYPPGRDDKGRASVGGKWGDDGHDSSGGGPAGPFPSCGRIGSMTSRVEFTFQWPWIAIWRLKGLPWASVFNIFPSPELPLSVQFGALLTLALRPYHTAFAQPPPSH